MFKVLGPNFYNFSYNFSNYFLHTYFNFLKEANMYNTSYNLNFFKYLLVIFCHKKIKKKT